MSELLTFYQRGLEELKELDLQIAEMERTLMRLKRRRRETISRVESTVSLLRNMGIDIGCLNMEGR